MKSGLYSEKDRAEAHTWLRGALRDAIKTEISHLTVSEWAERKRILPQGLTPLPGPWRWDVVPYLREIADCLSATSPVREVYVAKGAQIGYTVGVLENWIGYVIDVEPGPMMMVSADADMAEVSVELRVDRMIQSAGLSHKIFSQSEKQHGKKTGDTKRKKEFPGGFLMAVGPNSGSKLRSLSIQHLAEDEMDAWPMEVGGGSVDAKTASEGDPHVLARRRQDAYAAISKTLGGSTPLIAQTSRITRLHAEGDQRVYEVPCKTCGEYQALEWKRMHYDKDEEGRLVWSSVHYECRACGAKWRNEDKAYFLPRGRWTPTASPRRPGVRSYHIPSLLSPVGMRSWESVCDEWITAQGDQAKLRAFINTVLGEAYEERSQAPDHNRVMLRRENYAPEMLLPDGTWQEAIRPEGARVLTLGADIQHDRIECELVAWGREKESWSLGYHVLYGDTSDLGSGAWDKLSEILARRHAGMPILAALIDSGDQSTTVYSYCGRFESGVYPSKGDVRIGAGRRMFLARPVAGFQCTRIDLSTDDLKREFYALASHGPSDRPAPGEDLPAGYCHFPQEYDRKHFAQLFSHDPRWEVNRLGQKKLTWKVNGRDEALDCRVYNLGALYVLATQVTCADDDTTGSVDWAEFWKWADDLSY